VSEVELCRSGWQALTGDPLAWLLDTSEPGLHWRVLTELVQRPSDSPAVRRARSGANAAEPIASLLAELLPDGSWATRAGLWTPYSGTGWRLLAAVQLGADPDDPRLQAAAGRLVETAPGEVGLSRKPGAPPSPQLTARVVEGLAGLGWCRHSCFQGFLAWLAEGTDAVDQDEVTATAVLSALATCDGMQRESLRQRAAETLLEKLSGSAGKGPRGGLELGHPNLMRTDIAEMLSALRRSGQPADPRMRQALLELQALQGDKGRWSPGASCPVSLPLREGHAETARWITLRASSVLLHYAEAADLPRRFPQKPSHLQG
jgi:hypothetical protein